MTKFPLIIILFVCCAVIFFPTSALTSEILGPEVKIQNNDVIVSTSIDYIEDIEATIKSGIQKEIVFTLELFMAWSFWPDEFVVSRKVQRTMKYDNLRGEYMASSFDGTTRINKKFKDKSYF